MDKKKGERIDFSVIEHRFSFKTLLKLSNKFWREIHFLYLSTGKAGR